MSVGVINKAKRALIFPFNKLLLVPGFNLVSDLAFKRNEDLLEGHKEVSIEVEKIEDDLGLTELNVKKSTALIEQTNDEDVLAKWKSSEAANKNRKAIFEAIDAQLKVIDSVLIKKDEK